MKNNKRCNKKVVLHSKLLALLIKKHSKHNKKT